MDNSIFLENAMKKIKEGWSVDDLIRKLIAFSDSVEKAENTLFEQLYDIYFLYYPEAASMFKERDNFIKVIDNGVERVHAAEYLKINADSMGYDMNDEDLQIVSLSVNELKNIAALKKLVDERLNSIVSANYPNLSVVLGSEIAARMIYIGRKGKALASMPSSKLQVLGAEKAMFASRKKKATPKYGVIFHHKYLAEADENIKGKIAKVIASYASLAVKTDIFSKKNESETILKDMEEKIEKIKGKNGTKKGY